MRQHIKQFFSFFYPFLRRYPIEIGLIVIAGALAGGALFTSNFSSVTSDSANVLIKDPEIVESSIIVDIEGAIRKPGVYKLPSGARLNDLLIKAQGFSENTDTIFFQKNFNRSEVVKDQQKIYIPSIDETSQGEFATQTVATANVNASSTPIGTNPTLIGINSASESELDTLKGVGPVTAKKIIDNRPFDTIEQLLDKKIVGSALYNEIKDKITLD